MHVNRNGRPVTSGWSRIWRAAALSAVLMGFGSYACEARSDGYHLLNVVKLPMVSGWDDLTIDPSKRELFISNNSGVVIVNTDSLQVDGTIPNPLSWPGIGLVHGIALAPRLDRGFISREIPPSVVTFDLRTLRVLRTTRTAPGPDTIIFDPPTRRVFTFEGKYPGVRSVTALNAVNGKILGTAALPGVPQAAVTDGAGVLYVNIETRDEVARIDTRSLRLLGSWPLAPCRDPGPLAIDAAHGRLFAACGNRMLVMVDADGGRVIGSVASGGGTDALAFDAATGDLFASNGEGTLTIARETSPQHLTLIGNIKTEPGARTLALNAATHKVFLLAAQFGPPPAHPTAANPHGYPLIVPGSVKLLVFGP